MNWDVLDFQMNLFLHVMFHKQLADIIKLDRIKLQDVTVLTVTTEALSVQTTHDNEKLITQTDSELWSL